MNEKWRVPTRIVLYALSAAAFWLAAGCYSRTVRCTAPGASGAVIFEQERSERSLLKPDGWPDVLMGTPRTQTRTSDPAIPQPRGKET